MSKKTIVVSGDICINKLQWTTTSKTNIKLNWNSYEHVHSISEPGESLLLAKLIEISTNENVLSPKIKDLKEIENKDFLQSIGEIDLYEKSDKFKEKVYRVKRYLGFSGPYSKNPKLLSIEEDTPEANIVIIDDENNGFNASSEYWPIAIKTPSKKPLIIYKINNPIKTTPLFKHIEKYHINNTIVVINADDLRSKGVNISKSLSWEKTSQDFVWQLNNNPNLSFLKKVSHLVIPFGLEGAIYYKNTKVAESKLYFLPYEFEKGSFSDSLGKMYGLTSCFVAGLCKGIVENDSEHMPLSEAISDGIRIGITSAQKYFFNGFGKMKKNDVFPNPSIFVDNIEDFIHKNHVQDVKIPLSVDSECSQFWYILRDKSSESLAKLAYDIVKTGEENTLKYIPVARFRNLKTVDRTEIESYRSIKNLLWEYITKDNPPRPLSIAVFGTPGSGKSFGVTEVAESIAKNLIQKIDFNLSQFRSLDDLISAFHKVRDIVLENKIPLVFFDEFDSFFHDKLGWLKYFLAPMQDGLFREGDSLHPIGKAIFVFAGGTSSTFENFCGEAINYEPDKKAFEERFRDAKGPDFISRLRGYVNILGPNPKKDTFDQLFVLRRAMLLRSLIERKTPHLIDEKGNAKIDSGVLRALLKITKYKHESRSMEAILEMSMLNEAKKWEQSHLPSKEQLKLHVDEEEFLRLLMQDTFFSEQIETIAIAIHENYRELYKNDSNLHEDFIKPWDDLSEELKNSNREQARSIADAFYKINYEIVAAKDFPSPIELTDREIEIISEHEHKRWYRYKKKNGWRFGEVKDSKLKTDPELVYWDVLPIEKKDAVYKMVKAWPSILSESNFTIEKPKFQCKF